MADCGKQVGVRNISIRFYDCENDVTYGPIIHELASETQPTYMLCDYTNEQLPGGYVRRSKSSSTMSLEVIRAPGIPLGLYQGCGALDVTIEHFNGITVTGLSGTPTGENASDGHSVQVDLTFDEMDEFLPNGVTEPVANVA